jgi:hypothetical protein
VGSSDVTIASGRRSMSTGFRRLVLAMQLWHSLFSYKLKVDERIFEIMRSVYLYGNARICLHLIGQRRTT